MTVKKRNAIRIFMFILATSLVLLSPTANAAVTAASQKMRQIQPAPNTVPAIVNPKNILQTEVLPSGYRAVKIAQANISSGRKIYGFAGASINDQGKVAYVVIYDDTAAGQHSVLLFNGAGSNVIAAGSPTMPVFHGTVTHINNQGDVVFRTYTGTYNGNKTAIWLWRAANQLTMIQGNSYAGEPAINDFGQIVFKLNTGISLWSNGVTSVAVDESSPPFNNQYFIGDGIFMGKDICFSVTTKASAINKALFKRQSANGQMVQMAGINQIPLPYQIERLESDETGNLYAPVDLDKTKTGAEGSMMRSLDGTWRQLQTVGSQWYAVSMPYVAHNGVYAFWGMCGGGADCPPQVSLRESIYVVKNVVRNQVLKVKQQLTGRTIKRFRIHGVNSQGALVVEVWFEESGQYSTLFRLDPL